MTHMLKSNTLCQVGKLNNPRLNLRNRAMTSYSTLQSCKEFHDLGADRQRHKHQRRSWVGNLNTVFCWKL